METDYMDIDEMHQKITKLRNIPFSAEKRRDYWNEPEIKKLKSLYEDGIGISEIALIMERTENSIISMIYRQGLCRSVYNKSSKENESSKPEEKTLDCSKCLCPDCSNYNKCPAGLTHDSSTLSDEGDSQ